MVMEHAGTVTIKDFGTVNRMGFGALRIIGPHGWGEPEDIENSHEVLHLALELGINFIDTADSYGPEVSERIIAEALSPYPAGLCVATKAGQSRPSPQEWIPLGRPEYLRQQVELSLRRLKVDTLDLFQ